MMPHYYGIRHLSPAGSYHLLKLLDEVNPDIVLIEGPSDFNEYMEPMRRKDTKPPFAVMAYTESLPIETVLYPFAEYSPEYQAVLWAGEHKKECRFIDLPSRVFLAFYRKQHAQELEAARAKADTAAGAEDGEGTDAGAEPDGTDAAERKKSVYESLDESTDDGDQENYWERHFEHDTTGAYREAALLYGRNLRELELPEYEPMDAAENLLREAHMKYEIERAEKEGYSPDKTVVITGSFHTEGIKDCEPLSEKERESLPSLAAKSTMMPYSYYRLSARSGYGAGNRAPAYYELLWEPLEHAYRTGRTPELTDTGYRYLSRIAAYQRRYGHMVSTAEVIEAVRLAGTLGSMKGSGVPTLLDLRDAAMTCMGHGSFSEIALAAADTEIGTRIGSLPEGISRTSVQEDFYRQLSELKLEKYKSMVAQTLELDLRENTRVKTEKAAFLDLNRSGFLNRLSVLGIDFAKPAVRRQDNANWAENWTLKWTAEAEIQIVEAALKGDTIELAAAFELKERLDAAARITECSGVIWNACLCNLFETVNYAVRVLKDISLDSASLTELADTMERLSLTIRYGGLRRFDSEPLENVLVQLFLRACLVLPGNCSCPNNVVNDVITAIGKINEVSLGHETVDGERWLAALTEISDRDDLNSKASGYAAAILLERGRMKPEMLTNEVSRRLSPGIPADLGAAWFEGLAAKNKYTLIARLSLWKDLDAYIESLSEEEFKRAVVFLRRAFTEFSSKERSDVAENLGEIWGLNVEAVDEVLNETLTGAEQETIGSLDDFDFGDF